MSLLTNVLKLWRTGQYLLPADSGFMVKHLFANGEPGFAKLDFSGFAGMYQDRARTIPYTAVEQPLGSFTGLNGVTATAPADVNRGVVSARVNLLMKTEQFDDAVWVKDAGLVTPAAYTSPDGQVFQKYTPDMTTVTNHRVRQSKTVPAGVPYTLSFDVKAAGYTGIKLRATGAWVNFNLTTGAVGNSANVSSPTITALDDGIYRVSATFSVGASICYIYVDPSDTLGPDNASFAGDGTSGIYFRGASLTLSTDDHLPYQRVNTTTDYDTAGFPHYLAFNGTNTNYVTPSIDFTGTDNVTVWAGVTKLSDAAVALIASSGIGSGAFELFGPRSAGGGQKYAFSTRNGSVIEAISVTERSAPDAAVLTGISNTSGGVATLRRNGVDLAVSTASPSGVNHGNYPLYIGARAGTSQYFTGRLYSLIVRGAQSSLSQIEATENLIRKTMRLP